MRANGAEATTGELPDINQGATDKTSDLIYQDFTRGITMTVVAMPSFTAPARQRWESIPPEIRKKLLDNVWCVNCCSTVKITNFNGTLEGVNLVLRGECANCHGSVARVIEGA